jgi:hypothetical protein
VAADLAALGVRWVFVVHAVDWGELRGISSDDPGLRPVVRSGALDLWEVRGWPGLVVATDRGGPAATSAGAVPSRPLVEPLLLADPSAAATVARPGAGGWRRGTGAATVAPDGQLALPAGSGPVWYWPTVVVLTADVVAAAATGTAVARTARGRRGGRVGPPAAAPPASAGPPEGADR